MKKINMNSFAKKISEKEGKKVNLSIAQIKEVLKCSLEELNNYSIEQISELLKRYR